MVISIATVEDLQGLKRELVEEIRGLLDRGGLSPAKRWLKTEDVMRLLELSASTVQTLRRNGTLPFSRVGAVIFYDAKDVNRMLEERKQRKADLIQARKSSTKVQSTKRAGIRGRPGAGSPLAA